jgi:hypothetical protein
MSLFIPDIPYKVQLLFISVFAYIWLSAFWYDDYLAPMPTDIVERTEILVSLMQEVIPGI